MYNDHNNTYDSDELNLVKGSNMILQKDVSLLPKSGAVSQNL